MCAEPADEPVPSFGDLASELDELWRDIRVLRDVARGPAFAGVGVVYNERCALAGDIRELAHLSELAQLLFDPPLGAAQP